MPYVLITVPEEAGGRVLKGNAMSSVCMEIGKSRVQRACTGNQGEARMVHA